MRRWTEKSPDVAAHEGGDLGLPDAEDLPGLSLG